MKLSFLLKYLIIVFSFISISFSAQEKIIKSGSEWSYLDVGTPDSDWTSIRFSYNQWKKGITPLGYGDKKVKTIIGFGKDPLNKDVAKFFKRKFIIKNPFAFLAYEIRVQRDDGIVVYLNDIEVMRNNMPGGEINFNTTASSLIFNDNLEGVYHSVTLSPDDFVEGVNNLSVSVHQARKISSDCLFNLELIGYNDIKMLPLLLKERSMKNIEIESSLKELNSKLMIEKKDLEIGFLKQGKQVLYVVITLFFVLISFLMYALFYHRKNMKELLKKVRKLKKSRADKSKDLMNNSLNLVQKEYFLSELKDDLENSLSLDLHQIKNKINRSIKKIDYNTTQSDEWIELLNHFNSVHKNFIKNLEETHKSLTVNELRHCMFIKLRMQTKEIAQVLHINPRSVQASRYRIKKKMNLAEDIDLRNYLNKV